MAIQIKDEVIASENILYPVNVTKWEIYKVKDFDRYYAKIYFRKTDNSVNEFSVNVSCLSALGEEKEVHSDIKITDVDKKDDEFFKIIPINGLVDKLNVSIVDCSVDVPKQQNKFIINGIGMYELITYIISAIAVLFCIVVRLIWSSIAAFVISIVLAAGSVGLAIYCLSKKKNNLIMQIVLSIMATLLIILL